MIWASDPCNLKLHNPGQGVNFMIALNRDAGMIASWRLVRIESSLGGARKHRDHPYCLLDSYCSHESCLVFSRSRRFNANNTLSPAHASTVWLFVDNLFRREALLHSKLQTALVRLHRRTVRKLLSDDARNCHCSRSGYPPRLTPYL